MGKFMRGFSSLLFRIKVAHPTAPSTPPPPPPNPYLTSFAAFTVTCRGQILNHFNFEPYGNSASFENSFQNGNRRI